ncbi:protein TadG, associated with Flp pilus assembly [Vibrio nigripulchritudo ATCC 27043]|uniref:vWA domain-containing protein n=1 Tax=Vibrio nigripulchritudo TaxID=28173 RepID=UPI00021C2343|nr:VWA domain-containing protein [Vibrio nigripulchritudo]EGU55530.1 protein TadG, associated with Flp pilus assembly [Vibrio nigripulchritudo ATCC 27043]
MKNFSMSRSMCKQKGAAFIAFVYCLPFMIGMLVLAMQTTQQLHTHAKLGEAAEVASLGLISSSTGKNEPDIELAKNIVDYYMPTNKGEVRVTIDDTRCDYDTGCVQAAGELSPFADFLVTATTKHDSWISFKQFGMGPEFEVSGQSTSRKYLPKPVDIYFVVDFSGSMNDAFKFGHSPYSKLQVVKGTVGRILDDLENFNRFNSHKSRVALIGYNNFNYQIVNGRRVAYDQVSFDRIAHSIYWRNAKKAPLSSSPQKVADLIKRKIPPRPLFNDIELTFGYDAFTREFSTFQAGGGTNSWQGLLRTAELANSQDEYNPHQVIIVLSDGEDTSRPWTILSPDGTSRDARILKEFTKYGLCDRMVEDLENKKDRFGEPITVTFGVIGIDFHMNRAENGFFDCVGEKNVLHASSGIDVYKHILNLLNEETGRLKGNGI